MKTEPSVFGIDHLAKAPRKTTGWDGVRNYQVRNMLRDEMKKGDEAFLYHSSTDVVGIAGIVEIVKAGYPDATAFEKGHQHFDADSDPDEPRWYMVDVRLKRKFSRIITLDELRAHAKKELKEMLLLRRGNRLSITSVSDAQWRFILTLE